MPDSPLFLSRRRDGCAPLGIETLTPASPVHMETLSRRDGCAPLGIETTFIAKMSLSYFLVEETAALRWELKLAYPPSHIARVGVEETAALRWELKLR